MSLGHFPVGAEALDAAAVNVSVALTSVAATSSAAALAITADATITLVGAEASGAGGTATIDVVEDLIARRIVRRGRMRQYNWEEQAPSPLMPPLAAEQSPAVWVAEKDDDPIPVGKTVAQFTARLDAIERWYDVRVRKARKVAAEAKRQEQIRRLAEQARAQAEAALREAEEAEERAERKRQAMERAAEIRRQRELDEEEDRVIVSLLLSLYRPRTKPRRMPWRPGGTR